MPPVGTTDEIALVPCVILSTPTLADNDTETMIRGELPGVYWTPATKSDGSSVASEDTIDVGGVRHYIFQNAHRTERYSYFALRAS